MRSFRYSGITVLILACAACAQTRGQATESVAPAAAAPVDGGERIVSAKGYGVISAQAGVTLDQAKLLAMRAARLDAYRNLAERLQGLRIASVSNAAAFASQGDTLQTSAEYFLRGARVVSIMPVRDGLYEAVVEVDLDVPGAGASLVPAAVPAAAPAPAPASAAQPAAAASEPRKKSTFWGRLTNLFGGDS